MRAAAVVVAAGAGSRCGGVPKQLRELGGIPMAEWGCRALRAHGELRQVVLVLPAGVADDPPPWALHCADTCVRGGDTRQASVASGVRAVDSEADVLLVHDGARPFATPALVGRVLEAAGRGDPVVPALPLVDTVKEVDDHGVVLGTPDRAGLRRVQTPQGFPAALLRAIHREVPVGEGGAQDDALLAERAGHRVRTVEGERWNLKITTPEDLAIAQWLVDTGRVRPAGGAG